MPIDAYNKCIYNFFFIVCNDRGNIFVEKIHINGKYLDFKDFYLPALKKNYY